MKSEIVSFLRTWDLPRPLKSPIGVYHPDDMKDSTKGIEFVS